MTELRRAAPHPVVLLLAALTVGGAASVVGLAARSSGETLAWAALVCAGVLSLLWVASARWSSLRVGEEALCYGTWRGRRRVRWSRITRVTQDWPSRDLVIEADGSEHRLALTWRLDAVALLLSIRARVPFGTWQVRGRAEARWRAAQPTVRASASDPLPTLRAGSYRSAPRLAERVVPLERFRPSVEPLSWWLVPPAFVLTLVKSGWRAARRVVFHANAAVYWRRVQTVFGERVRLSEGGFTSLDGRWRYRACPDSGCGFWDELDAGAPVASYRAGTPRPLGPADERAPLQMQRVGRDWRVGLPTWLGGETTRQRKTFRLLLERRGTRHRLVRLRWNGEELAATWHDDRASALDEAHREHGVALSVAPRQAPSSDGGIAWSWEDLEPCAHTPTSPSTTSWTRDIPSLDELIERR